MIRPEAEKRHLDKMKQKRKMKIIKDVWQEPELLLNRERYVGHLVKGKLHCSCPMCAAKTNVRKGTYVYGWKHSDRVNLQKGLEE